MSDESTSEVQAPPPARKRGRPPGNKRKRHDATPAPIDGDYQPLDVVGKQAGFDYVALSDHDRQRRGHWYEVERWSETCAHPPWDVFTDDKRGKEVKINGQLTLMRIPTARNQARKDRELAAYREASRGPSSAAEGRGFGVTETAMAMDAFDVSGAY